MKKNHILFGIILGVIGFGILVAGSVGVENTRYLSSYGQGNLQMYVYIELIGIIIGIIGACLIVLGIIKKVISKPTSEK